MSCNNCGCDTVTLPKGDSGSDGADGKDGSDGTKVFFTDTGTYDVGVVDSFSTAVSGKTISGDEISTDGSFIDIVVMGKTVNTKNISEIKLELGGNIVAGKDNAVSPIAVNSYALDITGNSEYNNFKIVSRVERDGSNVIVSWWWNDYYGNGRFRYRGSKSIDLSVDNDLAIKIKESRVSNTAKIENIKMIKYIK